MSQGNIKIILVLLAVVMVGGVYLYVFKPNLEDKDTIQAEVDTLQARYDELKAKEKDRDTYVAQTEEYNKQFDEMLVEFPATLDQELSIMFIKSMETEEPVVGSDLSFGVESVGMGTPELFYSLGGGGAVTNGAVVQPAEGEAEAPATTTYDCYRAAFPINYTGSYEGIKNVVDYVMNYKYRMNLSSVDIQYDAVNDIYSGNINLMAYCVSGDDRTPDTVDVDVPNGVTNLFLGGEGAPSATTYSYDADNGAGIASDHDISIVLNNANNDGGDGIIVTSGGADSAVSSAENSAQRLTLSIYEADGKNYVDYSIGDNSYTKEITGADLTVYVESSERVDSEDLNGVRVTVDNKTTIPVFFKVDGDDATSPRFVIGSKTGTVKVY